MASKQPSLKVLVLTMGGERQKILAKAFSRLDNAIEVAFSPGIPSRSLRTREKFFHHCHTAGLLPQAEWTALEAAFGNSMYREHGERFFECLQDIPVTTTNRRGSEADVSVHYSVELWRKAKTINRGRAVLACALAHLIALKKCSDEEFDVLLEDNVRMPIESLEERMRTIIRDVEQYERESGTTCHMKYFGWLGSIPNLTWNYTSYMPQHNRPVVPCPLAQDIADPPNGDDETRKLNGKQTPPKKDLTKPGGNPVWGTYAYWISKDAYEKVLDVLRSDVGALMWKSKRMRYYQVKPIDKILPRQIREVYGKSSVVLPMRCAFFRAPMLTSKIHTQWDPEFCKSTEYQLQQTDLTWDDLLLTDTERKVVAHRREHGEWLTCSQLESTA